jgi:kynureninase
VSFFKVLDIAEDADVIDFAPTPGAAGYQVSNPSIMSLTALRASLSVYTETSMTALRTKSVHLTGYLEHLLHSTFPQSKLHPQPFKIITPGDPQQRGAQLSLLFREGLMLPVLEKLEEEGIVVDERKPDVIRVAPLPMYNTFEECWIFVDALKRGIAEVEKEGPSGEERRIEVEAREKGPTSP